MSFLARVAKGAEFRSTSGLANPAGWLTDALIGSRTSSGQRVTPKTALGLIPLMGAVTLISNSVGKLPLKVYRDLDGEKEEQRDHRAWRMLHDSPNPLMPARKFWQLMAVHLLLYANAFAEKRRSDLILVDELWPLDPATITIRWDPNTRTKTFVQYEGQRNERVFSEDDVIHFMDLSLDGIAGISRITECRMGLGTAQAREEFEGTFYKQGAVMSGVVEHPGKPTSTEATKNLRDSIAGIYGGSRKAHQVGVLWEGANFRPLTYALQDLEFVQSKQLSATEIAVLFNLPPARLGGITGDSLTYATVEGNQIQTTQDAIEPWTTNIQACVSNDPNIFPQSSYFAEFALEALMRGDHTSRADYYQKMAAVKAITVNEIRARENLPPLDGGDEIGSAIPETERITDTTSQTSQTSQPPAPAELPAQAAEVTRLASRLRA